MPQSLSEEGDRGGFRNITHHAKTDKLLKGAPIVDLEFKLGHRGAPVRDLSPVVAF
jgi:hypothetical protein